MLDNSAVAVPTGNGEHARDVRLSNAIARAKEGDWSALDFLYVRFSEDVYRYVNSIVRDHHEAEDITQNVFTKLMRVIGSYEERAVPFAAWIIRVARNAAIDHMRRRRAVPVEEVRGAHEVSDHAGAERLESLRIGLQQLPEDQREVVVLRHVAGMAPAEIAERLDKTEGSIHGLHHRGRGALKAALRELDSAPLTAS